METGFEKVYQISRFNFIQKHQIAEFVERLRRIGENFQHHVPFASVQAIGNVLMQLPMRTKFFLKIIRVGEFCNVLKFVNAYYYF